MPNAVSIPKHTLIKQVPVDCTEGYRNGWEYADWFISQGGSLHGDAPDSWPEEKANGYWGRMAQARKEQVSRSPSVGA